MVTIRERGDENGLVLYFTFFLKKLDTTRGNDVLLLDLGHVPICVNAS